MTKELITHKLPKLTDLYSDREGMIKTTQLNAILNADPKPEWIKNYPMATGVRYIPIERVEFLLTAIFGKWRVEILNTQLLANSIIVTVRLFVRNPLNQIEWDYQDGIGAVPIQIDKDAGATDFTKMKSNAIKLGAPNAESEAIKDAAQKFGKIFGKDLNRKDMIAYQATAENTINNLTKISEEDLTKIKLIVEEVNDLDNLNVAWINLPAKFRESAEVKELFNLKKKTYENISNTTTENS